MDLQIKEEAKEIVHDEENKWETWNPGRWGKRRDGAGRRMERESRWILGGKGKRGDGECCRFELFRFTEQIRPVAMDIGY